jgi:membrane-associated phospholipid phosphatase
MKVFLKHNAAYLFLYFLLLAYLAGILLNHGKVQIHQYINGYVGNVYVDTFFKYITELGDGLFAIFLVIILLFNNVKKAIYLLLAYSFASLLTTVLKNFVFIDTWRPGFVFQYFVHHPLKLVEGVFLNTGNNTLPSGHATAAFAVFFSLLFMSKNQLLKFLFFMLAILATFSRTYLSQHWLIDIYIGSIIGFSFSLFFYIVFYQKEYTDKFNSSLQILVSKKNKDV